MHKRILFGMNVEKLNLVHGWIQNQNGGWGQWGPAWRQGSGHEVVCSLDIHATVFQAKVRAIAECAQAMLEGDCRGMPVVICSDSQAALHGYMVRLREVLRCRGLLGELARANSVSLLWVPEHSGVIGNEKADRLANREARAVKAARCSVGLPACHLDELLDKWLGKMALKKLAGREGLEAGPCQAWAVLRQMVVGSPFL